MNRRAVLGVAILVALAQACAAPSTTPAGAEVASAVAQRRVFVATRRGVFERDEGGLRPFADVGLRPFALAARDGDAETQGLLLVGGGRPQEIGEVCALDLHGRELARAQVAEDVVYGTAIAPRAALGAAACADGAVWLLPLPGLAPAATVWRHDAPAVAVAFSPDGERLASCGLDGGLRIGEPSLGVAPRVVLDHTSAVLCLAWSRDGRLLASGARDGKVRLHDRDGRLVWTWPRLGGPVERVACTVEGVGYEVAVPGGGGRRAGVLEWP